MSKIDYSKQCWSCGGNLLDNKSAYVQCRSCGATWNEVLKPGSYPMVIEDEITTDGKGNKIHTTRYRPSAIINRKTREDKK
ncbi:MAG: hypothetical protein PHQ43_10700 [Dehalococcoidales bacterium]|nr:hypothetical protein [Dehalococcoidales bacterium]